MWKIPKIWEGGDCWIIGGGPSIHKQFNIPNVLVMEIRMKRASVSKFSPYLSYLHDKHVIAVNAAFRLGTWVDFIFYGDNGFFLKNKKDLCAHPKIKVGCNDNTEKHAVPYGVRYLARDRRKPRGISDKNGKVSWNGNSGASAINFAYHLGVKRIFLLGFDMNLGADNYQHWHSEYKTAEHKDQRARDPKKLPFDRHLLGFPQIAKDAKRLNLEIINVNPDSAINVFPKVNLKDII